MVRLKTSLTGSTLTGSTNSRCIELTEFLLVGADKVSHAVEFPLDAVFTLRWRSGTETLHIVATIDLDLGHAHAGGGQHVVGERLGHVQYFIR